MPEEIDLDALLQQAKRDKEVAEAATAGPWEADFACVRVREDGCGFIDYIAQDNYWRKAYPIKQRKTDADFIAHARTALPASADAVVQLVERVRQLEAALRACEVSMDTAAQHDLPSRLPPAYRDSWVQCISPPVPLWSRRSPD